MSAIEKELCEAVGTKRKAKEDDAAFFKRLIGLVQALGDEEWDALSAEAQEWVNAGAKAINADEAIPGFPAEQASDESDDSSDDEGDDADAEEEGGDGDEEDDEQTDDEEEQEEVAKRAPAKGKKNEAKKPAPAKAAKADKGKAAKADKSKPDTKAAKADKAKAPAAAAKKNGGAPAKKAGKGGAQMAIKKAVIQNPKAPTEDIVAKLKKAGFEPTIAAVSTIRSGTLQTLRLVKELGMPKGDF